MSHPAGSTLTLTTAGRPGAIAVIQLVAQRVALHLGKLTGRSDWPHRRMFLADLGGFDTGLAVLLRDDLAQIMPHGGRRVVASLIDRLIEMGFTHVRYPDARQLYPEASCAIEADSLLAISHAASPAAIDRLADQPGIWQDAQIQRMASDPKWCEQVRRSTIILDRLIDPPVVVVAGPANVGKSTLTNLMLRRSVSVVADLPGTTRDWVGGLAELGGVTDAMAVRWLDTPGLRPADDTIEKQAIDLAVDVIAQADLLIAMTDPDHHWSRMHTSDTVGLCGREPDLWVMNKIDTGTLSGDGDGPDCPLSISAREERGIDRLQAMIIAGLGVSQIDPQQPWAFSATLKQFVEGENESIAAYLGSSME